MSIKMTEKWLATQRRLDLHIFCFHHQFDFVWESVLASSVARLTFKYGEMWNPKFELRLLQIPIISL
jgi:hypothetical protein